MLIDLKTDHAGLSAKMDGMSENISEIKKSLAMLTEHLLAEKQRPSLWENAESGMACGMAEKPPSQRKQERFSRDRLQSAWIWARRGSQHSLMVLFTLSAIGTAALTVAMLNGEEVAARAF